MDYEGNNIESSNILNSIIKETAINKNIDINFCNIHNTDTFYNKDYSEYLNYNCVGVEMETYALFANAKLLNNVSAQLTVSDNLITKTEISSEEREKSTIEMIELALESILNI